MNPRALLNFFNTKIITTASGRIQSLDDIGLSEETVAFLSVLPDNTIFLVENTSEFLKSPAGVVPSNDPITGVIRIDVPVTGTDLVAKCAVRWYAEGQLFQYDIYFDAPTSDGCLKLPVFAYKPNIALAHAQEVWDRLVTGGFVMKSERPKSHVQ